MKFLCPNCKAKYRIGPEKMVGRQAAKIRCRKCEYLIQLVYRGEGEEAEVTATPPTVPPTGSTAARGAVGPGASGSSASGAAAARSRLGPPDNLEGSASKKPTAAVPGLPGLGSAKSTRGAALMSDPTSLSRRPLAPLPPPPLSTTSATGAFAAVGLPPGANVGLSLPLPSPPPSRAGAGSTPLGDQFRESVQAGGVEDLPQEGWFVGVNGVPLGPIPLEDLRELGLAGHIDRRSLVWREGQAEWRPLGKFPGLARVIDENAAPPSPARPPAAVTAAPATQEAPPARSNGSNGHLGGHRSQVATGFDIVRPDLGERPSVWGDIEDDDEEDEQPTTVKGRVSVLPPSGTGLSFEAPSSPAPLPSPAPAPRAAHPFPQSVVGFPAAPGLGSDSGLRSFSPRPDPSDDSDGHASQARSRKRLYLMIAAAVVVAFGLGVLIASQIMRASEPDAPAPKGARSERRGSSGPGEGSSTAENAAAAAGERHGSGEPIFGSTAPAPRVPTLAEPLLASPVTAPKRQRGKRSAASLDAATVQRTVRRQSAAVRRNCWPRASKARKAGASASATVTASITVHAAGHVEKVSVTKAPRGYPGLARCVESTVRDWRFPRAAGPTRTKVPFMFVGRG